MTQEDTAISLRAIRKGFITHAGVIYAAVGGIDLEVHAGKFFSIVGPNGCGKTTILNVAAGLMPPTAGTVRIFGEELSGLNRRASYMFQQDALLPWKTVLENVRVGLDFRGWARREADQQARSWLARIGLIEFASHFPH